MTVTCICLFIGAMGKSAQFPLHVWLPDSMEGPTPISALIHAATMVTAGIFMVSRMSPLFELSTTALGFIVVIGSITALFMGFLGIIQNDIKRVVAYSTLSQLGYMTVALGCSAYSVAIFHLMTHAFFKALLFLAAGSVIIGMHHDQDIRNMGGLRKYMPFTWITSLIGSLALIGTPFLSGFYSKDSIIEATHFADVPGIGFARFAVLVGVFVTAFYSFRMYFLVFHGKERWGQSHDAHGHDAHAKAGHGAHADDAHGHDDDHGHDDHHHGLAAGDKPHESPAVVWVPLVLLAIPSLVIGCHRDRAAAVRRLLQGRDLRRRGPQGDGVDARGVPRLERDGRCTRFTTAPFWLALAGVVTAWYFYLVNPAIPAKIKSMSGPIFKLLDNKYYLDRINEIVFAGGSRLLGRGLWRGGDQALIDGLVVNGSARLVGWFAGVARWVQTGFIYHYAIAMIVGVAVLLWWFVPLIKR